MSDPLRLRPVQDKERLLESWKEIAAYLNRTVRTAQRWEQAEGLPVRRHSHEKRDSVYASTSELDEWWGSRRAKLEAEERVQVEAGPEPQVPAPQQVRRFRFLSLTGVAALAALLVLATGTWYFMSRRTSALSFAQRDWVLITDFENQTGDPLFDKSLMMAFTAGFQQSAHANVVPRAQIESALRRMGKNTSVKIDEQLGREICLRENVRGMISCGIASAGRQYVVVARLVDPHSGEAVRSYAENAGDQGQILGALGRIATRIRRDLGESLLSIRRSNRPLPLVTTSSFQALTKYAQGNELWRKGQYREAVKLFQSALEYDPDFAMAHAALGNAYLSHVFSEPALGKEQYDQALRHMDRLTDRERLYIQTARENGLDHLEEAVRIYRIYLSAYPDDWGTRYSLGTLLMRHGQLMGAVEQLKETVRLAPNDASSRINLATSYRQLGQSNEALGAYAKAFELEPTWITLDNLNQEYGFAQVMAGRPDKARETFALALARPDTRANGLRSMALLDMYEGKYRDGRERLWRAILLTEDHEMLLRHARNHLFMSILLEGLGDRAGQLGELDRAVQALEARGDSPAWLSASVAVAYARAGAVDKAAEILLDVGKRTDRSNPTEVSELYRVEGEVALARGNIPVSLEFLQRADLQMSGPLTIESLAHGYERSGDAERAIGYYERLMAMRNRVLGWEPQQLWIAAHVRVAKFYRSRGDQARAVQALSPVAEIWKQADADLPLAREIGRLQAALRGERR